MTNLENATATAKRAIQLLDLTNLNDNCNEPQIEELCHRAITPFGNVAAVCIWSVFIEFAARLLAGTGIRIATVINFPAGGDDVESAVHEAHNAHIHGADEIDLVFPYNAFLAGNEAIAKEMVEKVRAEIGTKLLKVILETGQLQDEEKIRRASRLAIDAGADFIKTSTGKVDINATPEAARYMLEEIKASGKPVGFKPAGGMKTTDDAAVYLTLGDEIMGTDWISPKTFRFGASSVLDDLLAVAEGRSLSDSDKSSGEY